MEQDEVKESKVEKAKAESRQLRGSVAETLAGPQASFGHDDVQVLKFHGIYQQDDRDLRVELRRRGEEKQHFFMVRARIPGGRLTADQYLGLDAVADRWSESRSLRLTTRQSVQLHGVLKGNLRESVASLNEALVTTLAACGDVLRNVMASPAPFADPVRRQVRGLADALAEELAPATAAYHELWLNGEKQPVGTSGQEEPFYGSQYLPRKFKVAVAVPEDNCVDLHSQDVGLLGLLEHDRLVRVNVLAGGGLGMTHRKADTFARLGSPLGSVTVERAVAVVRAVAAVFRDHGDREDRRHARLKYLIEDWGLDRFRREVEAQAGFTFDPWRPTEPLRYRDHLGLHPQGDGRYFFGLFVESGRISDRPGAPLKATLRQAVQELQPSIYLTPAQNLILADLEAGGAARLVDLLGGAAMPAAEELSPARRHALACPALPTCGLALADAERQLPEVVTELEDRITALGADDSPLTIRMTGCPNGCARPYTADLGFVGRGPGTYDIYVGGGLSGERLAELYDVQVPAADLGAALEPLLFLWSRERQPQEELGAYFHRHFVGGGSRTLLTGSKEDAYRPRVEEAAEAARASLAPRPKAVSVGS